MFNCMDTLDSTTKALFRDPRKRRVWVIYQVSLQGMSLAAVARNAGVNRQTVYHAFDAPNPHVEKLLAHAVGLTPQQLFPERYTSEDLPTTHTERPKNSTLG